MNYQPAQADLSDAEIPPHLLNLTELLAENAHDQWAAQRFADGWKYGAKRDDDQKLHPCLVPYDQLPDSEKEYDRITALSTIQTILNLGYRILPPE